MSCCSCDNYESAVYPLEIKSEDGCSEYPQGNVYEEPVATSVLQTPTAGVLDSDDGYLADVKVENMVKEEDAVVKIEDEESHEGSGTNSFGASQYRSKDRFNGSYYSRTWHSIDDLIALGLHLRSEVKEEESELPVIPLIDDDPAIEDSIVHRADDVNPLRTLELPQSSEPPPKTSNSLNTEPIKKKRGPNKQHLKCKLAALFDSRDGTYHCDYCDYKAKLTQLMEYHRAKHTGEKPYKCKFCEYEASHPTTLKRHMRRHTGEKPHACKYCDYKGAQITALVQHVRRMHTGEKPYSCDVCPYKAHDLGTLAGHKVTHLSPDERPFECEVCGVKMTRRRHLMRHAKSKHPGQNVSLERRFSATNKNRTSVAVSADARPKCQKLFKKSKYRKRFGPDYESSFSLSSGDDTSSSTVAVTSLTSEDQEYRPDRIISPSNTSCLLDRPRRSIVPPKKLDL